MNNAGDVRMKCYAGIGSRDTPPHICDQMRVDAEGLCGKGWILRSGGARGADSAFEEGAGSTKEIYRAEDVTPEALEHAAQYHPAWDRCSEYARKLHGRNSMIMLGRDLSEPVEFVLCWTPFGDLIGGTAQALRIAAELDVPVFNYANAGQDRKGFEQCPKHT